MSQGLESPSSQLCRVTWGCPEHPWALAHQSSALSIGDSFSLLHQTDPSSKDEPLGVGARSSFWRAGISCCPLPQGDIHPKPSSSPIPGSTQLPCSGLIHTGAPEHPLLWGGEAIPRPREGSSTSNTTSRAAAAQGWPVS